MSVGVAIVHEARHLRVCIVDGAPKAAVLKDERASAIAAAATQMLDRLGVWSSIVADAQPINEMIVTDSKLPDVTRPVFLTFGREGGHDDEPFAHMVPNRSLILALRQKADALQITQLHETSVENYALNGANADIQLSNGRRLTARLLVAADGIRSRLREHAGIKTVHWPYDQWAIVTTVAHERDHGGRAEEHFLPAGPFATLPLKGNRSSLVWTEKENDAKRLLAMDEISFELELEQRFGHRLGQIEVEGSRKAFPLGLTLARDYVKDRLALAGDAAHGIHPIAGQGLNLGFKDAAALAETIIDAHRLGLDIGSISVLERYQQWRRFDTVQMGVVTDVLNRLFSNDNPFLRVVRDVGLGMVERMPGLKKSFISHAAGRGDAVPKLLQGKAI